MESQELHTAQCCRCLIKKEEYTMKPRPYDNHLCNVCYVIVSNDNAEKEYEVDKYGRQNQVSYMYH
jgi:hypothetical protein